MKSTSGALAKLQKSMSGTGLSLGWVVTGTRTSPAAALACNVSDLAAQASAQAQQIATASSVKLGAVSQLSISTSGCSLTASYALSIPQCGQRILTATASQTIANAAPDQVQLAIISITVSSSDGATFDQIVNALSGVGVTAANPNNVFGLGPARILWNLQLTLPFAQLENTTAALTSLEKWISQNKSSLSLSFNVSGTQFSGQASNKARTQAQQIAGAAGFQPGSITALSRATAACSLTASFATATFSQPRPNTITISASGTSTVQNDQAVIDLTVLSPTTTDPGDVTDALTANGVTGATLSGLYSTASYLGLSDTPQTSLDWSFIFTVHPSKLTATLAQIGSASQAIAQQNSEQPLNVTNGSASVSQTQQASACSQSTLVSSAQALAQQIATAAGVSVGPVLNISQGGSGTAGVVNGLAYGAVIGSAYADFLLATPRPSCALTVQYQLL